jgi:uncharacterized membrane protein
MATNRLSTLFAATAGRSAAATPVKRCQASATIDIRAPLDTIWALMTSIEDWPKWNPAIDSAVLSGDLRSGSGFVWKSQGYTVTSTLREIRAGRTLVWTGRGIGTRAVHRWSFTEHDDVVTVASEEIFSGWLPRLLPGYLRRMLEKTLPDWLAALKAAAERPR